MKQSDIVINGVYSNGKGRVRRVVDKGPQYKSQSCSNCNWLQYRVTAGPNLQHVGNMTVARFANWAKERIE